MKQLLFLAVIGLITTSSCNQQKTTEKQNQQASLNDAENNNIKKDADKVFQALTDGYLQKNLEKYFSMIDSTEFFAVNLAGEYLDYPSFKHRQEELFETVDSMQILKAEEQFKFSENKQVFHTVSGNWKIFFKNAAPTQFSFIVTLLLNPSEEGYKCIFIQATQKIVDPIVEQAKKDSLLPKNSK